MKRGYIGFPDASPPGDCETLSAPTAFDLVAESKARGSGGVHATGFQLVDGGTVSIVTGAGQTEAFGGLTLAAGFSLEVDFKQITASGKVIVTW